MEIKLLEQIGGFGAFCLFGAVLGVYYTAFKLLRYFKRFSRWAIFFQDVFFFVSSAVATFILLMNITSGEVRGYILIGVAIGFSVYYFSLGALTFAAGKFIIDILTKLYRLVNRFLLAPVRAFLKKLFVKTWGIGRKAGSKVKGTIKKSFSRLKKTNKKSKLA